MARKTNKTAHVLNLISKAKEEHQTDDDEFDIDTVESSITNDLSFMEQPLSNDAEIVSKIDDELRELARTEFQVDIESSKTILSNNENEHQEENEQSEESLPEQVIDIPTTNIQPEAVSEEPITANDTINEEIPANVSTTSPAGVVAPPEAIVEEVPYKYVNVLEEVVKSRVEEFLITFNACTCPRCQIDATALALNGLAPKYIVVEKPHVSPLLNFFSNHYRGAVTAQLSRACAIVKENPHH